jgi:hypothetical protein
MYGIWRNDPYEQIRPPYVPIPVQGTRPPLRQTQNVTGLDQAFRSQPMPGEPVPIQPAQIKTVQIKPLTLVYGNQPTPQAPESISALVTELKSWEVDWKSQKTGPYTPSNTGAPVYVYADLSNAIRAWKIDWNAQAEGPVAPLTLRYGNQVTRAPNQLLLGPIDWAAQTYPNNAGWNFIIQSSIPFVQQQPYTTQITWGGNTLEESVIPSLTYGTTNLKLLLQPQPPIIDWIGQGNKPSNSWNVLPTIIKSNIYPDTTQTITWAAQHLPNGPIPTQGNTVLKINVQTPQQSINWDAQNNLKVVPIRYEIQFNRFNVLASTNKIDWNVTQIIKLVQPTIFQVPQSNKPQSNYGISWSTAQNVNIAPLTLRYGNQPQPRAALSVTDTINVVSQWQVDWQSQRVRTLVQVGIVLQLGIAVSNWVVLNPTIKLSVSASSAISTWIVLSPSISTTGIVGAVEGQLFPLGLN